MSNAVLDKPKIKDDEFDIHGDLAVTESDDKSFVVLYDSSKEQKSEGSTSVNGAAPEPVAPTLDEINETHALEPQSEAHPEDAYIDDILSSDDIETVESAPESSDDDGPIALSSEELDGILADAGPEEEFHPDFPVDTDVPGHASPRMDGSGTVDTDVPGTASASHASPRMDVSGTVDTDAPHVAESHPPIDDSDDELPIALSDEDLDEILLEEEGGVQPLPSADHTSENLAPPMHDDIEMPHDIEPMHHDSHAEPALDDEGPIALSDDELDNILADAEAGHTEGAHAHAETDAAAPKLAAEDSDEILTLDDAPEITMIDDGAPTNEHASTDTGEHSFFDSDEDEPITLSDEELDGILSEAPEEEAPKQTDEVKLAELPDDGEITVADDDNEPIALSADELDGILMDADEAPHEAESESPAADQAAPGNDFFDADEDEPIALSADELDGIVATATVEEAPSDPQGLAELPPDDRYADVDHMDEGEAPVVLEEPVAPADDDDGPIALSLDELDGIAADAHEVTPEAPMVALAPLDTGRDEPSLAENTEKPATVFEEDLEAATLIHEDEKASAAPTPDADELKSVMHYLDNLLGELPDDVIEKFAQSEYFKLYQKIMDKLGL